MRKIHLFAPDVYPKIREERRAYTIAAFRIAQDSEQLSLVPMSKIVLLFLVKSRALEYWVKNGWLVPGNEIYRLIAEGLVICQSALAEQLTTHNTTVAHVEYWVSEFRFNSELPRTEAFQMSDL